MAATEFGNRSGDSNSLFSLKWNNYEVHLTGGLKSLLTDEQFADVTLACEGHYIRAHKLVLSLCSPYFKKLFEIHRRDRLGTIVILNHVKFKDLERLLSFAYTGQVQVPQADLSSFLKTGELLQIVGLEPKKSSQHSNSPNSSATSSDSKRAARLSDAGAGRRSPTLSTAKQPTFPSSSLTTAAPTVSGDDAIDSTGIKIDSTMGSMSDMEDLMGEQNSSGLHGDFDEVERVGFESIHGGEGIGIEEDDQDEEDVAGMLQYRMDEGNLYDGGADGNTSTVLPGPSRMGNNEGVSSRLGLSAKQGRTKITSTASDSSRMRVSAKNLSKKLGKKYRVCPYCNGLFYQSNISRHISTVHTQKLLETGQRVFICPVCKAVYRNSKTFEAHLQKAHNLFPD